MKFVWLFMLLGLWVGVMPVSAQLSLDALPSCNFTVESDIDGLQVGAVVWNLKTNRGCAENMDTLFDVASVPKLFVAGALYEQVANGDAEFDTRVTFPATYLMNGRGACLSADDVGRSFSLGYLSDIMITCSDNAATWYLMDWLGRDVVQDYVDRLGIFGIGPILPYSEVDKLKLTLHDENWANVPTHLASQFYRGQDVDGLVPTYFDQYPPRLRRNARLDANEAYYNQYAYNTITPRAMAEYLLKLRSDFSWGSDIAWWTVNTMLGTQRQFSTQALPGSILVGAKNGFDYGVTAEVNVALPSLNSRQFESIVIIFAQQTNFSAGNIQPPSNRIGVIEEYIRALSPRIAAMLYPSFTAPPPLTLNPNLTDSYFNFASEIEPCWYDYVNSGYADAAVPELRSCWFRIPSTVEFELGDTAGLGLVFENLGFQNQWMTFMFIAPNGRRFSYQTTLFNRNLGSFYWFHHLDQTGIWEIEVYQNLSRVYAQYVIVDE